MSGSKSVSGKSLAIIAIVLAVLVLIGAGAYFGKGYYDQRYAGETFYTMVPLDEPVAVGDLYDANGNPADRGYDYSLNGYNEAGEERTLEFSVQTSNADDLYQPGTYLKVEASPTLVLNQKEIPESEVPKAILERFPQD